MQLAMARQFWPINLLVHVHIRDIANLACHVAYVHYLIVYNCRSPICYIFVVLVPRGEVQLRKEEISAQNKGGPALPPWNANSLV